MIRLFDYSERGMGNRLFPDWLKMVQAAQLTNTLIRCEYYFYGTGVIVRKHLEQVSGTDMLGASDDLKILVSMARKRGWTVEIFASDLKNMYEQIRRSIDEIVKPTFMPDAFLAVRTEVLHAQSDDDET